jgi:hypothetical protein
MGVGVSYERGTPVLCVTEDGTSQISQGLLPGNQGQNLFRTVTCRVRRADHTASYDGILGGSVTKNRLKYFYEGPSVPTGVPRS